MTVEIGSLSGSLAASAFFLVLISAIEALVWIKARGRTGARVAVSITTVLLYALVWFWLWSGFRQITVTDTTVQLTSHLPMRVTTLEKSAVTSARWVPGYKNTWVLVVDTAGARYESARAGMSADARAAVREAFGR